MTILRQSTAVTIKLGPFLDSTDGVTAEGSLTISQADIRLSKNGGNYAQKNDTNAATHDELGEYDVALDTTDTATVGRLRVMVQESGALPVWRDFQVVEEAIYDAMFAASATGLLPANMTQISGDSTAADNLEAALDGTGSVTITADITGDVTGNLSGSVGSVTGNVGGNVVGSVASVTGNVGGNVVGSVASVTAGVTLANDAITSAKVADSAWQELIELCFTYNATAAYATATAGSLVKEVADNAGGSALTAAAIADAVWTEAIADHSGTAGSTAEQLAAAGSAGDPWATALPGAYTAGQAGKIIGDNINAPLDTIDANVDAILVDTGTTLPGTLSTIAGYIDTEVAAILVDTGTTLDGKLNTIDTVVDAIKAITDNLPDSGALTSIAQASALGTVDANVDAILVDTGTTLPASLAALNDLDAAGVRTAIGLASANLDTQLAALPTAAEVVSAMGTGTFLTAVPWNANWDAEVQSEVEDGIAAAGVVRFGTSVRATNVDSSVQADVTIAETP